MFIRAMISYTFTKTDELSHLLDQLETKRIELSGLILSREDELRYRWELLLLQIFYIAGLYDLSVRKSEVLSTFIDEGTVVNRYTKLKQAINWIDENWYVRSTQITAHDLKLLYGIQWKPKFVLLEHEIDEHLEYIQAGNDHPVIQAFMVQAVIFNLKPFTDHNEEFSHMVFLLFLYKAGYSFRKLLVIEDFFYHERVYFKDIISTTYQNGNFTMFIEYGIQAMIKTLDKLILGIREKSFTIPLPSIFFSLSSRQKQILISLDVPEKSITNKEVQKMFKVSQITASRELSKLVSLGLISSQGQGRGISYKLA